MLKIMNVEKSYSRSQIFRCSMTPIVKDVSFECPVGKAIAIIGESFS